MSRYDYYGYFYEPTQPISTDEGIKARNKRGAFAKNWWATRWIKALERLVDAGRLRRGRSYARQGQVLSIEESKGGIQARVQGSRSTPYKINIDLTPLSDQQWQQVIDALANQALFTAQLLAGEMPQEIEEVFQTAGVSLFPERAADLRTDCSCPDYANPCKHVAAVHYILGEQFDEDPFLLFRLRGRSQEQIMAALRAHRAETGDEAVDEAAEAEVVIPLAETLAHFWQVSQPLHNFRTNIKAPVAGLPLLRRLGQPAFVEDDVVQMLEPVYQAITQAAISAAYVTNTATSLAEEDEAE